MTNHVNGRPSTSNQQPQTEDYEYTQLSELIEVPEGSLVHLYGMACAVEPPRQSRGSDMFCSITITDPSLWDRDENRRPSFRLQVFAHDAEGLPNVANTGDIIRLHRIKVSSYAGKRQLQWVKFKSSFLLFSKSVEGGEQGAADQELRPYQASSAHYTVAQSDVEMLRTLRRLAPLYSTEVAPVLAADAETSNRLYFRQLKDITPTAFFDTIGQVLALDASKQPGVLYLWDGTDTQPHAITDNVIPPSQTEQDHTWTPQRHCLPLRAAEHVLCCSHADLPLLGTALPVLMLSPPPDVRLVKPGVWVKMRNLGSQLVAGQVQALFHHKSKLIVRAADDARHESMTAQLHDRVAANAVMQHVPLPLWLTGSSPAPFKLSSLRQILIDIDSSKTGTYYCHVRVLQHLPKHAQQFCVPVQPNTDSADRRWMYYVTLHLEDSTAELDAVLWGEDGTYFFEEAAASCDLRPHDLQQSQGLCSSLQAHMERLMSSSSGWVCCLRTSILVSSHALASRLVRISRTRHPGFAANGPTVTAPDV